MSDMKFTLEQVSMRDELFNALDLLGSLPSSMVLAVGDQVMSGVVAVLKDHEGVVK